MDEEDFIVFACRLNGDGAATPLEKGDLPKELNNNSPTWVHLRADHPDTRPWLEQYVGDLDHIILDALLAEETRPRVTEYEQGAMMILRGVNLNENAQPEDMVSVRIWIDQYRIITLRKRKLKAIVDMRDRLESGNGPHNSGAFLAQMTRGLFARMEPVIADLDERTDNIEERVIIAPDVKERQEIVDIRKKAIMLRRYIMPQKDVIANLRMSKLSWIKNEQIRIIQESYDRVTRFSEDLDMIRERAQIVKDELSNALADRLNHNMYVLSVIAAIFLPLGFLTGLFGINIGGMPGVDSPAAFGIFSISLMVLVAIQIWFFKKMKWF